MRALLLAGFIFAVFPTFAGLDLLVAAPSKGKQNANAQKGKSPEQILREQLAKAQQEYRKRIAGQNKDSKKQQVAEQILKEQKAKAQQEYNKRIAELRRKQQAEAEAKRRKELMEDKKRRNELRLASLRKEISGSATSIPDLEKRLQSIRGKRKKLEAAIRLTASKCSDEKFASTRRRLGGMILGLETKTKETAGLAKELAETKATCSKWKGSSGGGKEGGAPSTALTKMEEVSFDIKRGTSRVDHELKKAEAHYKSSTQLLFFCVGELVRGGVTFSSQEKASIRALTV